MLKAKTCLSITWDKNNFVYGAILCKRGKKFTLIDFSFSEDKDLKFSERLAAVYKKLDGDNKERVVIGGYIDNILTFSIDTPSLKISEIKKYLDFEISRYIPEGIDDFNWTFRPIIYPGEEKNKINRVKIIAIKKTVYDSRENAFLESGIKYDAFLYPFFILDPLYTATDLYLDTIDENFYSAASSEKEGWYMSEVGKNETLKNSLIDERIFLFKRFEPVLKEQLNSFIPCIILAEYALTPEFDFEKKRLFGVPPLSKPKRFKALKLSTFALFSIFICLLLLHMTIGAIDNYKALSALDKQLNSLKSELKSTKNKMAKDKKTDDYIQLVFTSVPDDINALSFLEYLCKILLEMCGLS